MEYITEEVAEIAEALEKVARAIQDLGYGSKESPGTTEALAVALGGNDRQMEQVPYPVGASLIEVARGLDRIADAIETHTRLIVVQKKRDG